MATQCDLLYQAYRRAKAEWDVLQYSPEYVEEDVPDEVNDPLMEAHTDALNGYLLAPAENAKDLAAKLRVFREEEIAQGWYKASEIVAALASDAHRIAYR